MSAWLRVRSLPGLSGIGLLLLAAAMWRFEVVPLEARVRALEERLARGTAHTAPRPPEGGHGLVPVAAAQRLHGFYAFFDTDVTATDALATLHAIAQPLGLAPGRAAYRLERLADSPLSAYSVTFTLAGGYPALRVFIDHALQQLPRASLDAVRFERRGAQPLLEATVTFSFFLIER